MGFGFVFFLDNLCFLDKIGMSILVDIFEFCCLVNLFFSLGFVGLKKRKDS